MFNSSPLGITPPSTQLQTPLSCFRFGVGISDMHRCISANAAVQVNCGGCGRDCNRVPPSGVTATASTTGYPLRRDQRNVSVEEDVPAGTTLGEYTDFQQPRFDHGAEPKRLAGYENSQVGTWITKCMEGQLTEVVETLDFQVQRGSHISRSVFYGVLKRCTAQKNLVLGRHVHALAVKSGYGSNAFVANHIIGMYASCERVEEAMQVFTKVALPNRYMWASIILAHARHGQATKAIKLYKEMPKENVKPDNHIFVAVLNACATAEDLASGINVHADILRTGEIPNAFVGNCLVDMYSKCGSLEDARRVFDHLPIKDVVTWTAMISGYAKQGSGKHALDLYERMQQEVIAPADAVTFVCLLQACVSIGALDHGKQLHAQIQKQRLESNLVVGNCLVNMYAKCGSLEDARRVFDRLPRRDVVTWNSMIAGYALQGLIEEAITLFVRMQQDGISPDSVTFACLLEACAHFRALRQGKLLHAHIQAKGLEGDGIVGNCLVNMYAKCGYLEDAQKVFDNLPTKDVITWNALITGYSQQGLGQEALTVYGYMQQEGLTAPDAVTFVCLLQACSIVRALHQGEQLHLQIQERGLESDGLIGNCLVNLYAKCGRLEEARRLFDNLPRKDAVTWNAMITGYVQHGFGKEALDLYAIMQLKCITLADLVTFVCLLQASSSVGALSQGQHLHAQIKEMGLESDIVVGSSLIDMYAKCGSLENARRVFDRLPARNVVTWNAMMAAYAQHGLGREALALYEQMQLEHMIAPDKVTFMCLLQACTSVGALDQGKEFHAQIQERGLEADVGSSLVDMYAKCGSLCDARIVFYRLPTKDVVTWNALLTGYADHGYGQMAMQCFKEMCEHGVNPDETTFICLLVACSHAGLVHDGQRYLEMMMKDHGVAPTLHHYNCLVDILARSGQLSEAENMLQKMPFESDIVSWMSLLTACKSHGDVDRGMRCFDQLTKLEPENAAAYVLMGTIFANAGRWMDLERIESLRMARGAWKKPAEACIVVKKKVHEFRVGDARCDVSPKLRSMNLRLKEQGAHVPQTELVLKAVSELEKEDALCGHAEKLALAYGLLNTPDGTTLLVTKNLRMCNDCHNSTKILSLIEKREVIVRDMHRIHHFLDGWCSCGDRH